MNSTIRTRIAPSPTGEDLHIGNLYTALINFAVARKNKGSFVIRIEDTDRQRFVKGSEEKILKTLRSFGILYDEGPDIGGAYAPYRQSERLTLYRQYADTLVKNGHAYYCFCSKERLEEVRKKQIENKEIPRYDKHCLGIKNQELRIKNGEPHVVRLNVLPDKTIWFKDVIRGEIKFDSNQIDDQVLLKSDGYPTYHLAVVVDDHLMDISHIIRAEEWISSTPKHIILYEAFGWKQPVFAHVPILRNPDRSKLSKRKNPVWAGWYLQEGYLPEAVLNYLALMGWSHPEEKEIFSLDEFIRVFDLKDVKPVGPIFDLEKLQWMNGEYIRKSQISNLKSQIISQNPKSTKIPQKQLEKIIPIVQTRMKTLNEFTDLVMPFFENVKVELTDKEKKVAQDLFEKLSAIEQFNNETILNVLKSVLQSHQVKMPVLYKILTGKESGLPIADMLGILGKEATLKKLSHL